MPTSSWYTEANWPISTTTSTNMINLWKFIKS
jgi:hypothetical protein